MELAVQSYLRSGHTLADLTAELSIRVTHHPTLSLVSLKYSQLDSPKTHPVVRDCRGIVLELDTWNVVAKPFRRFFNAGEDAENFARFDWSDFSVTTKEDGSLILLFNYANAWHVNTSGSFGFGECGFSRKSWGELFWKTSGIGPTNPHLHPSFTYIFEMWTPFNKVIRNYESARVFLLSAIHTTTNKEVSVEWADVFAQQLDVPRPAHHALHSMDEITEYLETVIARDKTYEGVVIRDRNDERYKIKTRTYLALHHLIGNGNLHNPKRLLPLVLAGECSEILAYFPEMQPTIDGVQGKLDEAFDELLTIWRECCGVENQGEFARAVLPRTPLSGILFRVRKWAGLDAVAGEAALRVVWQQSAELIGKVLYREVAV